MKSFLKAGLYCIQLKKDTTDFNQSNVSNEILNIAAEC